MIELSLYQIGAGFILGVISILWLEYWLFNHVIDDIGDWVERILGRRGKTKLKEEAKKVVQ
jgi:hypothetical protein